MDLPILQGQEEQWGFGLVRLWIEASVLLRAVWRTGNFFPLYLEVPCQAEYLPGIIIHGGRILSMCKVWVLIFFIARFSFQSVQMNEKNCPFITLDNGSPSWLFHVFQSPGLGYHTQNMEEPLGLPLSYTKKMDAMSANFLKTSWTTEEHPLNILSVGGV